MPFRFFKEKERFLVLQIRQDTVSALVLTLDADKKVIPEKIIEYDSWASAAKGKLERFKKNVIVAADSSLAFTSVVPVLLARENSGEALDPIELDNLLAQAVGKIFNQCREEAARVLRVKDFDIALLNSRVIDFKVDGHRVLNPLGFRSERIEAVLELTMTTKQVSEQLQKLLSGVKQFFFTEMERAKLVALLKIQKMPVGLLHLRRDGSSFFIMDKAAVGQVVYRGNLKWRESDLVEVIETSWSVSTKAAEDIYRKYLEDLPAQAGGMGQMPKKYLDKLIRPKVQAMQKELLKTKLDGHVYIDSYLKLPITLPKRAGKIMLSPIPMDAIAERLGLKFEKEEWNEGSGQIFGRLAPFIEFYYDNSDSTINHWLRRRLSWLGVSK